MKTVKVKLSTENLALLEDGSGNEREKLVKALFESLDENESRTLLSRFCTGKRETFDECSCVEHVEFDDAVSGTMSVGFTCSAYFGCKDQNYTDERDAIVQFELLIRESLIQFTTDPPEPPARSSFCAI